MIRGFFGEDCVKAALPLFPDQAVFPEEVDTFDFFLHPGIHLIFSDDLDRFGSRMVELGDIAAFGVEDVIAVKLVPLLVDVVIGADIEAVFIVDIESKYRRKMLGNFKANSGPDSPVAPSLLDEPFFVGFGDLHRVEVFDDPPEGLPLPIHESELVFEGIEPDDVFIPGYLNKNRR